MAKNSSKNSEPLTVEQLLAKANEPREAALKYHPMYRGKIEIALKAPVRSLNDFAIWYTPGVAEPCLRIKADKNLVFDSARRHERAPMRDAFRGPFGGEENDLRA